MRLIDADEMRENLEWCKSQSGQYNDIYWDDVIERLDAQPTIDAVPLDKLCEWLQENASLTYGTLISAAGWKYELTRWMEGLDAGSV